MTVLWVGDDGAGLALWTVRLPVVHDPGFGPSGACHGRISGRRRDAGGTTDTLNVLRNLPFAKATRFACAAE